MMTNSFVSIKHLDELGETIFCVYFYGIQEVTKYKQFLQWKGFRVDLQYECNGVIVFYQDNCFIPELDTVDSFHKIVTEDNMWEKCPSGELHDYRYRVITEGIICVSFIPLENAVIKGARKAKKE